MNISYKHLDARLRIAELTVGQWAAVLAGVAVAVTWMQVVSPFGTYLTMFTGVYVGALPVCAALFTSYTEFDLTLFVRSAVAWRRREGRVVAGAGDAARGYVVLDEPSERPASDGPDAATFDLARLWDS